MKKIVLKDAASYGPWQTKFNPILPKDWRKRPKKAASLITQTMDDSIVKSLDVHGNNPTLIWAQLGADYTDFLRFAIGNDESYIDIKLRYDDLLRKVTVQGGMIGANDRLQTLLGALPEKLGFFTARPISRRPRPWEFSICGIECMISRVRKETEHYSLERPG